MVMHDFKNGKIKADEVVSSVSVLLGQNNALINEFKKFVPVSYQTNLRIQQIRKKKFHE